MGFAEKFQQGHQRGVQELKDKEDRELEKMMLQHRLREMAIKDKMDARQLALQNSQLLNGQPAADLPGEVTQGSGPSMPMSAGGVGMNIPDLQKQFTPQTIPGVPELGVSDVSVRPQSQEQMSGAAMAAKLRDMQMARRTVGPDSVVTNDFGDEVFRNQGRPAAPPAPRNRDEYTDAVETEERERGRKLTSEELSNLTQRLANKPRVASPLTPQQVALVGAVMDDPKIYDDLTPSAKTEIASELASRGFSGFGRRLGEDAVNKLAESRSAILSLKDLRNVLQENEQFIGPVSGLAALNPYSDARKAQAKIDLVKQRVGKALEGGVLRKEDEEKYKKILATLTDTPATAVYKVDSLLQTLERDINTYIETQRQAGRNTGAVQKGQGAPHEPDLIWDGTKLVPNPKKGGGE